MPLRDKWIKKRWYVSAMEYYSDYSVMRKENILPSATTLMEVREGEILYDLAYMWNLKRVKLVKT